MKKTLSQIAADCGVSNVSVGKWGFTIEQDGRSKFVDLEIPANLKIYETKKAKFAGNTTPAVSTNTPTPQTFENSPPPAQNTPPQFQTYAEMELFREQQAVAKNAAQITRTENIMVLEKQKLELEIKKIELENTRREKEIAFEVKKIEIQDGKFISTEIIQQMLENTVKSLVDLEDRIITQLNYNDELQGEMIANLRKICRDEQKAIVKNWEEITRRK